MKEIISARKFSEKDLTYVQKHNFILSLQIQYCGDFSRDDAFTAVNGSGDVLGVAALQLHHQWDCCNGANEIIVNLCVGNFSEDAITVLLGEIKNRYRKIHEEHKDINVRLLTWVKDDDVRQAQAFLKNGFWMGKTIPVLNCIIPKEIPQVDIPQGIEISRLEMNDENIKAYTAATALANDGVPDSINELYFRLNDPGVKVFAAKDGEKIVAGITVWNQGEENGATENIFTIPEYRRKNLARGVIAAGMKSLKDDGMKTATLSVIGDNSRAMRLYQSIGYELKYYIMGIVYKD